MTKRRIVMMISLVVVVGLFGIAGWFLWTKTSLLKRTTPAALVNANNFNPANTNQALANLDNLVPSTMNGTAGTAVADHSLNLPSGFSVDLFAAGLDAPRFFAVLTPGVLVVADKGAGELVWLRSSTLTGLATEKKVIDQNLKNIHSVVWFDGDLYTGEENQVVKYHNFTVDGTFDRKEVIIPNLPSGGGHVTRTVTIGPDNKLYVAIGSSCNLCEEKDNRRAAVMQYNLDGTGGRVFSSGLRNSVGLAFRGTELWSVDNGRDLLGDNLPPEEVNLLTDGKNYGWPYCYGNQIANPEYSDRADYCRTKTVGPVISMQAHSAPLGLAIIPTEFSAALAGKLLISFHGSWNRTERTGYKLVWADPAKPELGSINFATGWLESSGVWGRPVGLGFDSLGALYVADDQAGVIYRIRSSIVIP